MLFGLALIILAVSNACSTLWLGTLPDRETVPYNIPTRWGVAILTAMLVDVNTEPSPAGDWNVVQFAEEECSVAKNQSTWALVHSTYDDPRVRDRLVEWLRRLLFSERVGRSLEGLHRDSLDRRQPDSTMPRDSRVGRFGPATESPGELDPSQARFMGTNALEKLTSDPTFMGLVPAQMCDSCIRPEHV